MVERTAMWIEIAKQVATYVASFLRRRAGGILKYLRRGWDTVCGFFEHGVGSMMAPDLEPDLREKIRRLQGRADVERQRRAEKQQREHEQTELGRAEAEAAKKAAAEVEKAAAEKATAGAAVEASSAPA